MSTITQTETQIQPSADPTPAIAKINLICEDRDTGKKCLFKDLKITLLPDQTFQIIELIEKNRSLQYFLNNCMIFQPSDDDMDIMIGFYPSEDISSQNLSYDQKTNITLKFEKIRPPSSENKNEESQLVQQNQNQISNNKQTNNKNNINQKINNNNSAHAIHSPNHITQESSMNVLALNAHNINFSESIQLEQKNTKVDGDITTIAAAEANKSAPTQVVRSQLSQEDLNNIESQTISSPIESEGSFQNLEAQVSIKIAAPNSQNEGLTFLSNNQSAFSKVDGSTKIIRKRKVSKTLDESIYSSSEDQNESSPCDSINQNEIPKNKKLLQTIKSKSTDQEPIDQNNIFSSSLSLNLNGKFPINLYSQQGLTIGAQNSSLNESNPLSNITNNNNNFNGTLFNGNNKSNESNVLNGFSFLDNQFVVNENVGGNGNNSTNNNLNRQSRNKERTIREAIEMVTRWRDLQEDYRQKHQVKGLQEVADELNISKKVLDYYFQELRTAEFFGFDFDSNLGNKMGVLRKFIDEQKKNHEQKNKNFKITRNLQFKYRLKDYQGSSFLSSCSSNNINNNDALSSTSSQKSKEKLLLKNQVKMDQINSLIQSGQNIQSKQDEMEIENDKNFNFPNSNNINALSSSLAQLNNPTTNSTNNQNIQDILSKNSPLFLQFLNNSSNISKQNSRSSNNSSSSASGMGFNLTNNNNSLPNTLNSLNILQSLNNNGFQMNQSHTENQKKQQSQLQNTNNIDKNIQLLDLFLSQSGQQTQYPSILKKDTTNSDKMNSSNNQMDNLYTLIKMLSTNDENNEMLSLQKSNSTSSGYAHSKFQDDEVLNKQQKLMKPQKVAVIQIRKQDE